jgi:hypothetical protein
MVVHTGRVFGDGLQRLFTDLTSLEVVVHFLRDYSDLLRAFYRFRPEVVLLTRGIKDLANASSLLLSPNSHPNLRVIVISEDDNLAYIYDKQEMVISKKNELLTLVLDDSEGIASKSGKAK